HQVPQRRAQPLTAARGRLGGEHQLRGRVLHRRRHHRPQVRRAPPVQVRASRNDRGRTERPRGDTRTVAATLTDAETITSGNPAAQSEMDYHSLNALLNLYGPNGEI